MIWSVRKQQADSTHSEMHRFTKHFLLLNSISREGIRYLSHKVTEEAEESTEGVHESRHTASISLALIHDQPCGLSSYGQKKISTNGDKKGPILS